MTHHLPAAMESQQNFRSLQARFQASQPQSNEPPRKPPKPEVNRLRKFPPPEVADVSKKPPPPEVPEAALKPSRLDSSHPAKPPAEPKPSPFPKKPLPPEVPGLARKPPDVFEAALKAARPDPNSPARALSEPKPSPFPKKPPSPEVPCLPPKQLPQPKMSKLPQMPEAMGEPQSCSPQPNPHMLHPKKPPQPGLGSLPRTCSEPEVSVLAERPRQPGLPVPAAKPPQPGLGSLPRTCSEPEVNVSNGKSPGPPRRPAVPRKVSQPEPNTLPKQRLHPHFLAGVPRKPPLPGSVSDSSLPMVIAHSGPQFLQLSPGFAVPGKPHWGSGGLTHKEGSRSDLRASYPPRRRPLPAASSLGPPPAKPPLPPGPVDIQSFRKPSVTVATALQRTSPPAGTPSQALPCGHPKPEPEYIYEFYDDLEPRDHGSSSPSPSRRGPGDTPNTKPATRPPKDVAPRKERVPQSQQSLPTDAKLLKQIRKAEKAEKEFRKKFKFEGEIVVQTKMMVDPNAKARRGGGTHLGIRRGEILEVIEFTSKEEMLCRDPKGKYGYVPRTALLPLETEVYDDVGVWGMWPPGGDSLESGPFPREQ
ncbi:PML-RARA-regulated adapter molecule 1 [Ochotona princeps]|uniref:PML-RARA-regulated adapter molecule 1 n=1 Tax=Ochotona princeps TaxID=9978 RepID=UPI0027154E8F|nr:PML-RARA-regulated adapter molecule 1 [Ochotona princeps]